MFHVWSAYHVSRLNSCQSGPTWTPAGKQNDSKFATSFKILLLLVECNWFHQCEWMQRFIAQSISSLPSKMHLPALFQLQELSSFSWDFEKFSACFYHTFPWKSFLLTLKFPWKKYLAGGDSLEFLRGGAMLKKADLYSQENKFLLTKNFQGCFYCTSLLAQGKQPIRLYLAHR